MMRMSFYLGANFTDLLFKGWSNHTDGGLFGACVVFFLGAALLELLRELLQYCRHEAEKNPLTYAKTEQNISRTPTLIRALIIPDQKHIKKRRIKFHVLKTLIHMVQYSLGMTVMLAVMAYNAWFLISVILGAGIGHYSVAVIHFRYEYNDSKMENEKTEFSPDRGAYHDPFVESEERT